MNNNITNTLMDYEHASGDDSKTTWEELDIFFKSTEFLNSVYFIIIVLVILASIVYCQKLLIKGKNFFTCARPRCDIFNFDIKNVACICGPCKSTTNTDNDNDASITYTSDDGSENKVSNGLKSKYVFATNDDSEPFKIVLFGASFFDFVTDVAWFVEVCATLGVGYWALGSGLSVFIPYFANLFCAIWFISWLEKNKSKQTRTDSWVKRHKMVFMMVVGLTGNGEPVLQLFNSKIFNQTLFSMGLRYKVLNKSCKVASVILNCCLERIPQFVLQILYIVFHPNDAGGFSAIALLTSTCGVLATIVNIMLLASNNEYRDERISVKFNFKINDEFGYIPKMYHKPIKQVFSLRRKITKEIANALGMDTMSLKCQYTKHHIHSNKNEMEMVIEIISNDDKVDYNLCKKISKDKALCESMNDLLNEASLLMKENINSDIENDEKMPNILQINEINATLFYSETKDSARPPSPKNHICTFPMNNAEEQKTQLPENTQLPEIPMRSDIIQPSPDNHGHSDTDPISPMSLNDSNHPNSTGNADDVDDASSPPKEESFGSGDSNTNSKPLYVPPKVKSKEPYHKGKVGGRAQSEITRNKKKPKGSPRTITPQASNTLVTAMEILHSTISSD